MAKFLIAVWPFVGHYFPLIAVAQALRQRGHEVAFYTGSLAQRTVVGEGFKYFSFGHIDERVIEEMMFARVTYSSRRQPLRLQALLREWLLGTLPQQITDLTPILDQWQPDIVISETSMLGPMLVLHETRRIPVAVFSTVIACLLPGSDVPPFGPGLPLPRRRRDRLAASMTKVATNLLGVKFRQTANHLRAQYGLTPLSVPVTEYTGHMPLYLVPSVPEFDYGRRDLLPSVHYVGPCLWNKPVTEPPEAWLTHLPNGRPVVHVSEGTMHTDKPLVLQTAVQALGDLPLDVVMTTGGNRDPADLALGQLASNIRVVPWVAHSDLLPRINVLITTGGAGTVMAALAAGVPLVVIPTEWDKFENAQRVVEAGVGVRLPLRQCTPDRLRDAVNHVLETPTFRQNAKQMSAILQCANGPERAAGLLEGP